MFIVTAVSCVLFSYYNAKSQPETQLLAKNTEPGPVQIGVQTELPATKIILKGGECVNDFENNYSDEELEVLRLVISNLASGTSARIYLVTFDSSMLIQVDSLHTTFPSVDLGLAEDDGILHHVVLKICVAKRMVQIEDLAKKRKLLPSRAAKIINTSIIPLFSKRKLFEGSLKGLKSIMKELGYVHNE